jgi:hypothetical protein
MRHSPKRALPESPAHPQPGSTGNIATAEKESRKPLTPVKVNRFEIGYYLPSKTQPARLPARNKLSVIKRITKE